jgi:hypothetical protein
MLVVVALSGLHCIVFLLIPWEWTIAVVKWLEIRGVPDRYSPITEYWMLMMAALCVVIGYLYFVAALNPPKYRNLLPILGWALVFIGITAAYHGFRLGLPPWPFCADVGICAVCGPGIVCLAKKV